MSREQTAKRYAQALYDVTPAEDRQDVNEELKQVLEVLREPQIEEFFSHPKTPLSAKKRMIMSMQLDSTLASFLPVVIEKGRERALDTIAAAYQDLVYASAGIRTATVTSAIPLSDDVVEEIRSRLEDLTECSKVELTLAVDEKLWGGLVIEMNGKVIDASLSRTLERLRQKLVTVQS